MKRSGIAQLRPVYRFRESMAGDQASFGQRQPEQPDGVNPGTRDASGAAVVFEDSLRVLAEIWRALRHIARRKVRMAPS